MRLTTSPVSGSGLAPILAVSVTVLLWSSAFPAIRVGLEGFTHYGLAAVRFALASAVLLVLALATKPGLPRSPDIPRVVLAGGLGIAAYNILLNLGEVTVSAGTTSILVNIHPIVAALAGLILLRERLGVWGWFGIAAAFAGVATIAMTRHGTSALQFEAGALYVLAAAVCFGLHFVVQKPLLARYGPLAVATWMIWSGTLFLLPFLPEGLASLPKASGRSAFAAVYLAIGPAAMAYFAWAYALARFPVGRAATFLYLGIPATLLIAFFWIGEVPAVATLAGGALTLAGVIVVNTLGRPRQR
jgi:drug/metabolite transporter (DMT)-like permease